MHFDATKKIYFTLVAILLFSLSSCATPIISKEKCKNTDWSQEGLSDGSNGREMQPVHEYVEICAKYKFIVDVPAYQKSYDKGLPNYCTYSTGESLGRDGYSYPTVCDMNKFPQVNSGWKKGVKSYCSFSKGKEHGSTGASKRDICHGNNNYMAGWEQGALDFCTPSNGFYMGKQGKAVVITCPSSVATSFNLAYEEGHKIKSEIDAINNQIKTLDKDISSLKQAIKSNQETIERNDRLMKNYPDNPQNLSHAEENLRLQDLIIKNRADISSKELFVNKLKYDRSNLEARHW